MEHTYWRTQSHSQQLFPDLAWSKPEQRSRAGHLGIVGGNKLGFVGVAEAYATALETGVGRVTVLLPDVLKKTIPTTILDTMFAASTASGGLAKDAMPQLQALGHEANSLLFIGDAGRNSETAVLYEQFLQEYQGMVTLSRDAIDLVKNNPQMLIQRQNTVLVASFAQIQKLFRSTYYPKMITFSMHLMQLVESLHKFTITYPVAVVTLHKDTLIIAHEGQIVTQNWENPMAIWRGTVATRAASWWMWNEKNLVESIATSIV